jgi:hypothetical protein
MNFKIELILNNILLYMYIFIMVNSMSTHQYRGVLRLGNDVVVTEVYI